MDMNGKTAIVDIRERLIAILEELDGILVVEEKYIDSIPKDLRASECCERAHAVCAKVEDAMQMIGEAMDSLKGITND